MESRSISAFGIFGIGFSIFLWQEYAQNRQVSARRHMNQRERLNRLSAMSIMFLFTIKFLNGIVEIQ
jgi:hypothetical protein